MGISLQDTWNSFMEFLHGAFSGASFFEMGCEMWNFFVRLVWQIFQLSPTRDLAQGQLWDISKNVMASISIVGATLLTLFCVISFIQTTADLRNGISFESVVIVLIKVVAGQAILLNLSNILEKTLGMGKNLVNLVTAGSSDSLELHIDSSSWQVTIDSLTDIMFGKTILLAIAFVIVCLACGIVFTVTVYKVFFKIFFYIAIAPIALATIAGPREAMQTGIAWIKTYASALLEWMGMMLVLRLGAALIHANGLVPQGVRQGATAVGNDSAILQLFIGVIMITASVSAVDSMIRRAMGV